MEKNADKISEKTAVNESSSNTNENDFIIPYLPEQYKADYDAYISEVKALASTPIIDSITSEYITNFKHYNLRYYEDKYCVNFDTEIGYNDLIIRIHSNKLFLISLASGNDIIRADRKITGINFMINNSDRSEVKLGGKRKKGAKVVGPNTILCQVKCEGIPKMFNIRAGIPGRILEINDLVKTNPNLLRESPKGNGFLAIMAPLGHPANYEMAMSKLKLLNHEEYVQYLNVRISKIPE